MVEVFATDNIIIIAIRGFAVIPFELGGLLTVVAGSAFAITIK